MPTPNIIAAVSLATSQGHCAASSTSPRPRARPDSAPAARPMPIHGKTSVSIRFISTFTAAVSAVPRRPTIQYIAVMPVANNRLVTDVGAAWPSRVFKSATLGLSRAKPMRFAREKPMRRYSAVPTHTLTVVPTPAPTTPSAGTANAFWVPKPLNPKINSSESATFTRCITSKVFM